VQGKTTIPAKRRVGKGDGGMKPPPLSGERRSLWCSPAFDSNGYSPTYRPLRLENDRAAGKKGTDLASGAKASPLARDP
jgi:hypothetical protein